MRTAWQLALGASLFLTGCGTKPATVPMRAPVQAYKTPVMIPGAPTAATPGVDPNDMSKNPFVLWVKKTYPKEASSIITRYMSSDGKVDKDRDMLRTQALTQVTSELYKEISKSLPKGITATKVGNSLVCGGITEYQGHKISVRFEFVNTLRQDGLIKIDQPESSVYAEAGKGDFLVDWFGGDLRAKARSEIVKNLDKEGPINATRTPGLAYVKGGYFLLNPGVAFVNLPG